MFDIETVIRFLGWCAVLNIGLLLFSIFILVIFNAQIKALHGKLIAVDPATLNMLYFNFLGHYKIAILILNLVPYLALKILVE